MTRATGRTPHTPIVFFSDQCPREFAGCATSKCCRVAHHDIFMPSESAWSRCSLCDVRVRLFGGLRRPVGGNGAPTPSALTATTPESDCDQIRREHDGTTATTGSTGRVEIGDFFVGGVFFVDDTILRAKAHPECVAHLSSPDQAFSAAGALIVSSDSVGTPAGPPAPFAINPDERNEYVEFPDPRPTRDTWAGQSSTPVTGRQAGALAMGGEIRVRDVPGSGCVFTVDLPGARSF
jgi:hypothetical protein